MKPQHNPPIFREDFNSIEDIMESFEINCTDLDGVKIIFAWYGCGCYDGSTFVLFEKDKKLYEVNGWHHSGFNLSGQWEPEETTKEALFARIKDGSLGKDGLFRGDMFASELSQILEMIS